MSLLRFPSWLALVLLWGTTLSDVAAPAQILSRGTFHLRSGAIPEWDEFRHRTPDGAGLSLRFSSQAWAQESTLLIHQDNVKLDWTVQLNGKKIGTLFLMEAPLIHALSIPAGSLIAGENTLTITPPKENDDIMIGPISLEAQPLGELLGAAGLDVQVDDADSGVRLPCRLTIVDRDGNLAPLVAGPGQKLAVRPGVVYAASGIAKLGLLPGEYTVYATRGFEYGLGVDCVSVTAGQTAHVRLRIRREVDTTGWVCSDTHIHTGTYARHGDATIDERAITLASEGIELPISTEHDCLVDFTGAALRTGVQAWLTPVVGEEVTTTRGHFNIFPVDINAPLPDKKVIDWPRLMDLLRATPGVQVIVLNHPRNIHTEFQPFAATNFNAVTGENLRRFEFNFDAIEVANSSALQSDWMVSYRDWFALLNYGYRFTAVGSSDVHDVSRYIVGQGRTYIRCEDANPARINIDEACRSLKQGHALVSLGLLTDLRVNARFGVGDLATGLGDHIHLAVTVQGPSWVKADRIELFANGIRIRDQRIPDSSSPRGERPGTPLHLEFTWDLPRPAHDVHLVALASGPGVREPFWALARPYQPSSPTWDPRVVGLTNPVWIDADDDGKFTSARDYAQRLLREHGAKKSDLLAALASYDQSVAAQVSSLCQEKTPKVEF